MDKPTEPPPAVQSEDNPVPQICCDCGFITREPVKIGEAWAQGGAGRDIYACPSHAPRYLVGGAQ